MACLRTVSMPSYLATSLGAIFIKFDSGAILGFVFDSVFAVFRYGTHACRSKIAKSANLIKFARSYECCARR